MKIIDAEKYRPIRDAALQSVGVQGFQGAYNMLQPETLPEKVASAVIFAPSGAIAEWIFPAASQEMSQLFGTRRTNYNDENGKDLTGLGPLVRSALYATFDVVSIMALGDVIKMNGLNLAGLGALATFGILKTAENFGVNLVMNNLNNGINRRFNRKHPNYDLPLVS